MLPLFGVSAIARSPGTVARAAAFAIAAWVLSLPFPFHEWLLDMVGIDKMADESRDFLGHRHRVDTFVATNLVILCFKRAHGYDERGGHVVIGIAGTQTDINLWLRLRQIYPVPLGLFSM